MIDIDKNSFKTLRLIYRYREIEKIQLYEKLSRKNRINLDEQLKILYLRNYVRNPSVGVDDYGQQICDESIYYITHEGDVYVEKRVQDEQRWLIPVILSAIALVFSALSLAHNIVWMLLQLRH